MPMTRILRGLLRECLKANIFSKRRRLLKLFRKSFTKTLYDFGLLLGLSFQTGF